MRADRTRVKTTWTKATVKSVCQRRHDAAGATRTRRQGGRGGEEGGRGGEEGG